ncbi:MAG: mannose-6-phosphate isomerase, partial [Bacteroidales bacterium]|nr:mannose-6-phosphate isomerase [Bacteroidales bacterium]
MRKTNYDKYPATKTEGLLWRGWEAISSAIKDEKASVIAVDCYGGVFEDEIIEGLHGVCQKVIRTRELMKPEAEVRAMTERFMTDDVLFGYVSPLRLEDFFSLDNIEDTCTRIERDAAVSTDVICLIIGPGAALFAPEGSVLVYADMARWEIQ